MAKSSANDGTSHAVPLRGRRTLGENFLASLDFRHRCVYIVQCGMRLEPPLRLPLAS